MNRKNTFKIVIAFVVVLALVLPSSAVFTDDKKPVKIDNVGESVNEDVSLDVEFGNDMADRPVISINNKDVEEIVETTGSDVDWWPMYGHDLNNTGYSTSTAPNTYNLLWTYGTASHVISSAIVDGKVFVAAIEYFYCLDASDGSLIWECTTSSTGLFSSPSVVDGKIYMSNYCLNATDGSLIWQNNHIRSYLSHAVADGKVYICSRTDNNVYCLDATDGSVIWSYTTSEEGYTSPAVVDGKIYFGSYDDNLYCLNASDGSLIWNYTTGGDVRSSPAVVDGKVFFGSLDSNVYCLDASDGSLIWIFDDDYDVVRSSPAVAYGKVFIGNDNRFFYCLDASDGSLIWRYAVPFAYSFRTNPAVADGKVFVDNWCFDATDGSVLWETGLYRLVPTIADDKVFWPGGSNREIYCFGSLDHDFSVTRINGLVSGTAGVFTPEVVVENYGLNDESAVPVNLEISQLVFPNWVVEYDDTVYVDIESLENMVVTFPDWTPKNLYGGVTDSLTYKVTACAQLPDDDNPDNDWKSSRITLDYLHDVGVKGITEPCRLYDGDWIHFDDGINYDGIGAVGGGTFEAAIRITPAELSSYDGQWITSVKFYHHEFGTHSGNIKIYELGASTRPGPLITSEPYTVTGEGWFEILLSEPVFLFDADEDVWVSVEITHEALEYPLGVDDGPAVDGKGDWYYYEGLSWMEIQYYGLDYNWNIWAKVEEIDPWPPGTYPIECIVKNYGTFNESDFNVNATIFKVTDVDEVFYHDDVVSTTMMGLDDEVTFTFNDVTFNDSDDGIYILEITTELVDDGVSNNDERTKVFVIGFPPDTVPPTITIEKEKIGFRKFKFTANVNDPEPSIGINRTEFYLDGEHQATFPEDSFVTNESYEWTWQGLGNHTVTAVSYDNMGNNATASTYVPSIIDQILEWLRSLNARNTYI